MNSPSSPNENFYLHTRVTYEEQVIHWCDFNPINSEKVSVKIPTIIHSLIDCKECEFCCNIK